jgi:hypothetical protein
MSSWWSVRKVTARTAPALVEVLADPLALPGVALVGACYQAVVLALLARRFLRGN